MVFADHHTNMLLFDEDLHPHAVDNFNEMFSLAIDSF